MANRSFENAYREQLDGWVGDSRVELSLATRQASWEELLMGSVFLTGGQSPQIFQIGVGLAVYGGESSGQVRLPCREWRALAVGPGESQSLDFELQVPWGTPIRNLQVRAVVRSGWRRRAVLSASVEVLPPPAFQKIAAVVAEVAEGRVTCWSTTDPEDAVAVQFVPGKTDPKPYEVLRLNLYRNEGRVHGTLSLDLAIHPVTDRRSLALGVDRVCIPFCFPENDLREVRPFFEHALRRLFERHHDLPVPSMPPVPSATDLPLPADAGAPDWLG